MKQGSPYTTYWLRLPYYQSPTVYVETLWCPHGSMLRLMNLNFIGPNVPDQRYPTVRRFVEYCQSSPCRFMNKLDTRRGFGYSCKWPFGITVMSEMSTRSYCTFKAAPLRLSLGIMKGDRHAGSTTFCVAKPNILLPVVRDYESNLYRVAPPMNLHSAVGASTDAKLCR